MLHKLSKIILIRITGMALGVLNCALASGNPHYSDFLFRTDTIHEIRIQFKQSGYWDTLIARYDAYHLTDSFNYSIPASAKIDTVSIDSIGIRLKGNSSFNIPGKKKPIKLDFNFMVKNKTLFGLRALNLSNEYPDPSMLRNTTAFKILRDAGVLAPRTGFAKVYVNDNYFGLYVLIEQIDKSFLENRFRNKGGELIKPISTSLYWNEYDTASFKRNYEIKSGESINVWNRLMELTRKIHETGADVFYDSLKHVFDFDSYLKVFAADIVFNNWDSYFFGQNYYLYRDTIDNKYYYLPWDYNISMNNYEVSGGDFDILPEGSNTIFFNLPLPKKIVGNSILKKKYLDAICRINKLISEDSLEKFITSCHLLIQFPLLQDKEKGFMMSDYNKSLNHSVSTAEIDFVGLIAFIRYRSMQINEMLSAAGHSCSGH